ncbi:hypothetical protein N0V83_001018 [Neocucurbitaria cava]|uniref:Ankyrin repeat protein n=1 Tax=Neocucurbitaria cava TaxID=798079 RepID=A0A9W8YIE0_9PLEO|nr:hypothetical protein N0V83_001018 [Neocucurbitaria cava]
MDEIPSDLHQLLRDILTRDTDDSNAENNQELILCMQWVLFANVPLRPEELYFAVLAGIDTDAPYEWNDEEVDFDVIRRFILDASKGLADATRSEDLTVQFIHESVRDLLLKEHSLGQIWPHLRDDFQRQSYEALCQCCFSYMSLSFLTHFKNLEQGLKEKTQTVLDFDQPYDPRFPFLEHALSNVFQYKSLAGKQILDYETFVWKASPAANDNVDATSTLHVLADITNPAAIVCIYVSKEGKGALHIQPKGDPPRTLFILKPGGGALSHLAKLGDERVFAFILKNENLDVDAKDDEGRPPLFWATIYQYKAIVKLLLEAGADSRIDIDDRMLRRLAITGEGKQILSLLADATAKKKK